MRMLFNRKLPDSFERAAAVTLVAMYARIDKQVIVFLALFGMRKQFLMRHLIKACIFIELWLQHGRICGFHQIEFNKRIIGRIQCFAPEDLRTHAVCVGRHDTHHERHGFWIVGIFNGCTGCKTVFTALLWLLCLLRGRIAAGLQNKKHCQGQA